MADAPQHTLPPHRPPDVDRPAPWLLEDLERVWDSGYEAQAAAMIVAALGMSSRDDALDRQLLDRIRDGGANGAGIRGALAAFCDELDELGLHSVAATAERWWCAPRAS